MITIRLRWRIIFEPVCWLLDHRWSDYVIIHVAWNHPGRWCRRCRRSIIYRYVNQTWNQQGKLLTSDRMERTEPWFKVEAR